ncbi:MAG: DUF3185 family protein [Gammaproteobacteria bacterium]|nr:DUF3185 family protein [Gammaproteobacteria bacterium]
MRSNTVTKAVGLALVVAGIGLILWGLQMSDSLGSQISEALTGAESDPVMNRYIAGGVCLAVGAFLFTRR